MQFSFTGYMASELLTDASISSSLTFRYDVIAKPTLIVLSSTNARTFVLSTGSYSNLASRAWSLNMSQDPDCAYINVWTYSAVFSIADQGDAFWLFDRNPIENPQVQPIIRLTSGANLRTQSLVNGIALKTLYAAFTSDASGTGLGVSLQVNVGYWNRSNPLMPSTVIDVTGTGEQQHYMYR